MPYLAAALAGLIFGAGLVVSGMVNPAVVLGFLDLAGDWNPALALVMAGALAVALPGYWLVAGRTPLFAPEQRVPTRQDIDAPLVAGAALFGVGWGLAGICPGPGVTLLAIAPRPAIVFLIAMAAGMLLHHVAGRGLAGRRERPAPRLRQD